jgi:hypothetical protein
MKDERDEEGSKPFSTREELLEMFRNGWAFTEELMGENERLRYRIAQLEREKMDLSGTLMREMERLRMDNSQLAHKIDFFNDRFQQIEAENKDFAQRYVEVEEQNESLANLYVASYRLHSTLDPLEVIECISEILINMVGSEEFGLFVLDDESGELALAGYEGEIAAGRRFSGIDSAIDDGERVEEVVARTGETVIAKALGEQGDVWACIPLKIKQRIVGVIAVYRLLAHKKGLTSLDHRLLELLAGHAATALVSSRLYAEKDRKLRTMQGFMSLLRSK